MRYAELVADIVGISGIEVRWDSAVGFKYDSRDGLEG